MRKITLVLDSLNDVRELETEAVTLGDLKRDLDNLGINYDRCTFQEGTTLAIFNDDDSILPRGVKHPVTGEITDDIAIMVAKQNKNIDSGRSKSSVSLDRAEAYKRIKGNGLADKAKESYGKHITNFSTDELYEFLVNNGLDKGMEIIKLKDKSSSTGSAPKSSAKKANKGNPQKEDKNSDGKPSEDIAQPASIDGSQKVEENKSEVKETSGSQPENFRNNEGERSEELSAERVYQFIKDMPESERGEFINSLNRDFIKPSYSNDSLRSMFKKLR